MQGNRSAYIGLRKLFGRRLPPFNDAADYRFTITFATAGGRHSRFCTVDGVDELIEALNFLAVFYKRRRLRRHFDIEACKRPRYRRSRESRKRNGPIPTAASAPEEVPKIESSGFNADATPSERAREVDLRILPNKSPSPSRFDPEEEPIAAELEDVDDDAIKRRVEEDFRELLHEYGGDIDS